MHKEAPDKTPHKVTLFYWLQEALWGLWEQADILQDEEKKKKKTTLLGIWVVITSVVHVSMHYHVLFTNFFFLHWLWILHEGWK